MSGFGVVGSNIPVELARERRKATATAQLKLFQENFESLAPFGSPVFGRGCNEVALVAQKVEGEAAPSALDPGDQLTDGGREAGPFA